MARVCMVAYTHYPTDSRVRREAEALAERGDKVDFICLGDKGEKNPDLFNGINLFKISISRYRGSNSVMYLMSYVQFFMIAIFMLTKLHLKNSYQVIQVHTMPDFMVFVALLPKLMGAKVLLDVHDLMPELYESKFGLPESHPLIRFILWMERISVGFADRAIAVHQPHLEALCQHGNPPQKFTLLLNLPDPKIFTRTTDYFFEKKSGLELIYHGTVSKRHGLEVAIKAVSALRSKIEGLKFSIIGDGDDIPRLSGLIKDLNMQEVIQIGGGMLTLDELVPLIQKADIGIIPIIYDEFTKYMLPVKLLEYVALGKPVICSRTSTIEAYFNDSMVQYFSPSSIDGLAECILYLYRNIDRRKEIIANADKFNREYNWNKQKKVYFQLIDTLIEGNSSK